MLFVLEEFQSFYLSEPCLSMLKPTLQDLATALGDDRVHWLDLDALCTSKYVAVVTDHDENPDVEKHHDSVISIPPIDAVRFALRGLDDIRFHQCRKYFTYNSLSLFARSSEASCNQSFNYMNDAVLSNVASSPSLLLGLHPDQATDDCVDASLANKIPFAIVPCCVFPTMFPHRKQPSGEPVTTFTEYLDYLQAKDQRIRRSVIESMVGPNNIVLYMRPHDFL
jgi:hypothetical protein